jgi:hypothetical protein
MRYKNFGGNWFLRLQSSEDVAECFSETLAHTYQTSRRYIPEDSNHDTQSRENLRPALTQEFIV